jgi:hypothetical protein
MALLLPDSLSGDGFQNGTKVIVDLQDYVGLIKKKLILEQIRSAGFQPAGSGSSPRTA